MWDCQFPHGCSQKGITEGGDISFVGPKNQASEPNEVTHSFGSRL
jgi:hypothetical protein